jgi:hypothetical protein
MTNELVTPNSEVANIRKAARGTRPPFVKFKKGIYYINADEVDAAFLKRQFFAYCADWRRGWRKWSGDEVIVDHMVRVADDPEDPCLREELDDRDKTQWKPASDGEIRDPWCLENQLPIEDVETGERFIFATPSAGGGMAVTKLCDRWGFQHDKRDKGLPIIELGVGTFSTRKYKNVPKPLFKIIAWENGDAPDDEPIDVTPPKDAPLKDFVEDEVPY